MKTIGTVINTVIIIGGMGCAFFAGSMFGYSIRQSERRPYTYYWPNYNPYKNYKKGGKRG